MTHYLEAFSWSNTYRTVSHWRRFTFAVLCGLRWGQKTAASFAHMLPTSASVTLTLQTTVVGGQCDTAQHYWGLHTSCVTSLVTMSVTGPWVTSDCAAKQPQALTDGQALL